MPLWQSGKSIRSHDVATLPAGAIVPKRVNIWDYWQLTVQMPPFGGVYRIISNSPSVAVTVRPRFSDTAIERPTCLPELKSSIRARSEKYPDVGQGRSDRQAGREFLLHAFCEDGSWLAFVVRAANGSH